MDDKTLRNSEPVRADAGLRADAPAAGETRPREIAPRPLPDDAIAVVPVRNVVLFPGTVIPLTVGSRALARRRAGSHAAAAPTRRSPAEQARGRRTGPR